MGLTDEPDLLELAGADEFLPEGCTDVFPDDCLALELPVDFLTFELPEDRSCTFGLAVERCELPEALPYDLLLPVDGVEVPIFSLLIVARCLEEFELPVFVDSPLLNPDSFFCSLPEPFRISEADLLPDELVCLPDELSYALLLRV